MAARARRFKRQRGVDLVVVDYLQLMHGSTWRAREGRVQEVTPGWYALARTWQLHPIAAPHADIFGPALPQLGAAFGKAVGQAVAASKPSH